MNFPLRVVLIFKGMYLSVLYLMLIVSLKTVIFGLKLRLRLVQICHFAIINKRPIGLNADDFFLSLQ